MTAALARIARHGLLALVAMVALPSLAAAQVTAVDPDKAIDGDLVPKAQQTAAAAPVTAAPAASPAPVATAAPAITPVPATVSPEAAAGQAAADPVTARGGTYREDDLIGAAEGVFGKGAKGLADAIKDVLKKQGEPNAYIVGREGGGAFVVGVRYGSGTLYHKVEGTKPVYWTGPSVGLDAGANAGNTFVLVYNLYDTEDLYKRFASGEGQAYLVGGFNVSYLRKGDVVMIPVRLGVGLRLGINAGYMKVTKKQTWSPF